jgi:hypothetical protein
MMKIVDTKIAAVVIVIMMRMMIIVMKIASRKGRRRW